MMMDDERNIRDYNEARKSCLLRDNSILKDEINCNIKKINILSKTKKCLENEPYSCPLFVFLSKIKSMDSYDR